MFALHCLSKNNHLVCITGFASVLQHQKCHLAKSSSFPQCPVVITHLHITVAKCTPHTTGSERNTKAANCRMCLQSSEGHEIKSIHLLNCTGQGQHRHMVTEWRAGFAMLAPCFHLGQEVSALTGLEGSLQPTGSAGWMCQMSLPSARYLCYLEMHPAPNRNNRDGSRFKAPAQTLN